MLLRITILLQQVGEGRETTKRTAKQCRKRWCVGSLDPTWRTKTVIFFARPEAQGVVCGAVYLCIMFLFIPVPFYEYMTQKEVTQFPFSEVSMNHRTVDYLLPAICFKQLSQC